jgi:hypothetical protein
MRRSSARLVSGYTSSRILSEFCAIRIEGVEAGGSHELFTAQSVVYVHPEVLDQCSREYGL